MAKKEKIKFKIGDTLYYANTFHEWVDLDNTRFSGIGIHKIKVTGVEKSTMATYLGREMAETVYHYDTLEEKGGCSGIFTVEDLENGNFYLTREDAELDKMYWVRTHKGYSDTRTKPLKELKAELEEEKRNWTRTEVTREKTEKDKSIVSVKLPELKVNLDEIYCRISYVTGLDLKAVTETFSPEEAVAYYIISMNPSIKTYNGISRETVINAAEDKLNAIRDNAGLKNDSCNYTENYSDKDR